MRENTSSIFDGEDTIPGVIWIVTSIASLNWGMVEFLDLNLVDELALAVGEPFVATLIYGVVGIAGLITLLDHLGVYDVTDVVDDLLGDGDSSRGQMNLGAIGSAGQVKKIIAAVGLIGAAVAIGFGGIAAAGTVEGEEFGSEDIEITNDTDTVYANVSDVENGPVMVTFFGYNATDDEFTEEHQTEVDADADEWELVDYAVEHHYDEYRVVVSEDPDSEDEQSVGEIEFGQTEIGAAGGVFEGEDANRNIGIVLVALVGLLYIGRRN